jgi:hypothetical protein
MDWHTFSLVTWAALVSAFLALEAVAQVKPERLPSIGDLLDVLVVSRAGRWLALTGWLWLGWHLFIRR